MHFSIAYIKKDSLLLDISYIAYTLSCLFRLMPLVLWFYLNMYYKLCLI